jgi:hypothetical protein
MEVEERVLDNPLPFYSFFHQEFLKTITDLREAWDGIIGKLASKKLCVWEKVWGDYIEVGIKNEVEK